MILISCKIACVSMSPYLLKKWKLLIQNLENRENKGQVRKFSFSGIDWGVGWSENVHFQGAMGVLLS